jgi:hypothetical protein
MAEAGIYEVVFVVDEDTPSVVVPGTFPDVPPEIIGEHSVSLDVRYSLYDVPVGYVSEDNPSITLLGSRFEHSAGTQDAYLTDELPFFLQSNVLSWRDENQAGWRVRLFPVPGALADRGYEVVIEVERRAGEAALNARCQINLGFPTWTATSCSHSRSP